MMEQYMQPFIDVCSSVFKEILNTDITPERPYILERDEIHGWDISGIMGFSGEARGAVVLSMKEELALTITSKLMNIPIEQSKNDMGDAIGELTNIIAGNVKKPLEGLFRLVLSLPTVVKGANHKISWPSDQARAICIPFRIFEIDYFGLSFAISKE